MLLWHLKTLSIMYVSVSFKTVQFENNVVSIIHSYGVCVSFLRQEERIHHMVLKY